MKQLPPQHARMAKPLPGARRHHGWQLVAMYFGIIICALIVGAALGATFAHSAGWAG